MHKTQRLLLQRLVRGYKLGYAALTQGLTYDDNVLFHLKQLKKEGLVVKKDNRYHVTRLGVKESAKFDLDTLEEHEYKTIYISLVILHDESVALKRLDSDTSFFYKFPGGYPYHGEPMDAARQRIFADEVHIPAKQIPFSYRGIHFVIHRTSKGNPLFDHALVFFQCDLSHISLKGIRLKPHNSWYTKEDIAHLENKRPEIDECLSSNTGLVYSEYAHLNNYNIDDDSW